MPTNTSYQGPKIAFPYTVPSNTPAALLPFIKPLYVGMQAIIQSLVRYAGIGPRNRDEYLTINGDPTTVLAANVHRFYTTCFEEIPGGSLVNLFPDGLGGITARLADASDPAKYCNAYYSGQLNSGEFTTWTLGSVEEVILQDGVYPLDRSGVVGALVPGTSYYLSATTPGTLTDTPPSGPGQIEQFVGFALSSDYLKFWPWPPILH